MRSRLALLCPGQGAQGPAMFDLARGDAATGALLDSWLAGAGLNPGPNLNPDLDPNLDPSPNPNPDLDPSLDIDPSLDPNPDFDRSVDLGSNLNLDPARKLPLQTLLQDQALLFSNRMAQPLIVAATLATWTALGPSVAQPAIVAGYSIGELAAYAVAGALAPGNAVRLARQRAGLMDACLHSAPQQALVALSGIASSTAAAIARVQGFHPAIETAEDSLIVGGLLAERDALVQAVMAAGGRATVLPVEVASHTPFMAGAVAPFAALLRAQGLCDLQAPVLSGIAAEPIHQSDKAIDHLSRQLAEPILWHACMDALAEAGVTVALELGPGAALAHMLQARHPGIACRSVADFRSLEGVRAWLSRHVD